MGSRAERRAGGPRPAAIRAGGRRLLATAPFATALFTTALFGAASLGGCGARSSLETGESAAQGGGSSTSTTSSTSSSTTSSSSTSTSSSTTTTTTSSANLTGCADGEREGFLDLKIHPFIAACAGGFQVPGVLGGLEPTCDQKGGDDGGNPNGLGCSAWDLCAFGWHVCESEAEVAQLSMTGCEGAAPGPPAFFVTRQSGPGCGLCAMGSESLPGCESCNCVSGCLQTNATANDVFGCGTVGTPPNDCGVLNAFSNDGCADLGSPWSCGIDGCAEAKAVSKIAPEGGGVLCCADMLD